MGGVGVCANLYIVKITIRLLYMCSILCQAPTPGLQYATVFGHKETPTIPQDDGGNLDNSGDGLRPGGLERDLTGQTVGDKTLLGLELSRDLL